MLQDTFNLPSPMVLIVILKYDLGETYCYCFYS